MPNEMIKQTVEIVTAYLHKNEIDARDLPGLIKSVFLILLELSKTQDQDESEKKDTSHIPAPVPLSEGGMWTPVVPLDEAVTQDEVICLICGKRGKALKGHLTRSHKMRLEEYRKAFNLPKDFRMVAPSYSEKRRQLAIDAGLGEKLQGDLGPRSKKKFVGKGEEEQKG